MTKDDERFIQLGDTHIKDTLTGEEWYAPCEDNLLSLLNEFDKRLFEKNSEIKVLKCKLKEQQSELENIDNKYQYLLNKNEKTIHEQEERINELEYYVNLLSNHKDILVDIVSRDSIAKEYLKQLGVIE